MNKLKSHPLYVPNMRKKNNNKKFFFLIIYFFLYFVSFGVDLIHCSKLQLFMLFFCCFFFVFVCLSVCPSYLFCVLINYFVTRQSWNFFEALPIWTGEERLREITIKRYWSEFSFDISLLFFNAPFRVLLFKRNVI